MSATGTENLPLYLRTLKLPSFAQNREEAARRGVAEGWSYERYLADLAATEIQDRDQRHVERLRRQSRLPADKTRETLDESCLPVSVRRQLAELYEGGFVERAENVLAFGLTGRGKTHCLCAVGHELVLRRIPVLFTPAYKLVQELLAAKRDLELQSAIRRLERFEAVILDDIGYVQQSRDEMDVLFTFLAERYERRSVLITSNLVFSQWDRIFKDPMTTACAVDRVVHHATILELTGESYREKAAKGRQARSKKPAEGARE